MTVEEYEARLQVVESILKGLAKLALGLRGRSKLTPQQRLDAYHALVAAIALLEDDDGTSEN